jgi:glycosyltransferase involved in cell wall biosynthesis
MSSKKFTVAFDDVSLQIGDTGIARYWRELTSNLASQGIFQELQVNPIFLGRTSFKASPTSKYLEFPSYDFRYPAADRALIDAFCQSEGVDLFVSSYYTYSTNTPNLVLVYDLIPEVFGFTRMNRGWLERELAMYAASSYLAISQNTKNDLLKFYPHASEALIGVGHPGIDTSMFSSQHIPNEKVKLPKRRYFVCVGSRYGESGYKNGTLLVDAINLIENKEIDFELWFIGGEQLTSEEKRLVAQKGLKIHTGRLEDSELVTVIKEAEALIYPSKYEGFGMPPLEALALGTPVVTTRSSSIPEAVGNLALFVGMENANQLAYLLLHEDFNELKLKLKVTGPERASKFSWENTAKEFGALLSKSLTTEQDPNWRERQKILAEYSKIAINLQH